MAAEYTTSKVLAYGVLLQSLYSRLLIVKYPTGGNASQIERDSGGRTWASIMIVAVAAAVVSVDRVSISINDRRSGSSSSGGG